MITSDGYTGIVGQTFASSTATNDYFVLVRRGAARGDRLTVLFQQIGSSASAAQVEYDVVALERATAWDDVAFQVPVKPIGFANSCWRVLVAGSDSGIILAIGP